MKIICDIDGTLSNPNHRLHFIQPKEGEKKDWDGFFAACVDDTPIPINVELCHELLWAGEGMGVDGCSPPSNTVEFWTGRNDAVRNVTREWLMEHVLLTNDCYHGDLIWQDDSFPATLKMRSKNDRRPDHVLKMEFIDWNHPPDIIFEDRSRVVKAYRELGLTVFQVAEGDF